MNLLNGKGMTLVGIFIELAQELGLLVKGDVVIIIAMPSRYESRKLLFKVTARKPGDFWVTSTGHWGN
ncbi:hypothetical protein ACGIJG_09370 [Lacticaseibacillus rhamnosus]|uniref:hypothetical protein n=1 Tax=Lacticaseibacillus rhamnosus TaxID=47715 RepID=UPI003786FB27